MRYVVSERALQTIERECRRYPDEETGGIMVGLRDKEQVIMTHATGPGPNSQRSAHHFVKDTPYLQSVLNLLAQYYQVNYLGVWHKHPGDMAFPSAGDVASAMDEISDSQVGLDELLTPICVMESGNVEVLPYIIRDSRYSLVSWDAIPHDQLPSADSLAAQWYVTAAGHGRLGQELARFKDLGVSAEVRKGEDGTYRFYAPMAPNSPLRLVMLCYNDYPVSAPEVAVYDERSQDIDPVASRVLEDWGIDHFMCDIFEEYRRRLSGGPAPDDPPDEDRAETGKTQSFRIFKPSSAPENRS